MSAIKEVQLVVSLWLATPSTTGFKWKHWSSVFFLKNIDPNRWSDVKSVQINVGKMTDTQLLEELRSDPTTMRSLLSMLPQFSES